MKTDSLNDTHIQVQKYYGETLRGTDDLKSNACCTTDSMPLWQKKIILEIEPEILDKFYGCGSPIPLCIEGKTILDLGCGTGRDVYLASKLAGQDGFVIGVDMTDEQLEIANKYLYSQTQKFGYSKPNVEFKKGIIEDLKSIGIKDNSIDLVISNCVINLAEDKESVFKEIFRVLKPGGELYFSDVFSDRRIPTKLKNDPVLYGECLSNAMYFEDFRRLLSKAGILDYRIISKRKITIDNTEIEEKIGMVNFHSITVRAFNLNSLEDICEDYGQIAIYLGTIKHARHKFELDDHHIFEIGKPNPVCGNTADMLQNTRFKRHFQVIGDKSIHYGIFPCGSAATKDSENKLNGSCC